MRHIWPALALLTTLPAHAGDYLPTNRMGWWDAQPPPTAHFRDTDTLEGWFHAPLLQVFDAADGDPQRLHIRSVNGVRPQPALVHVVEGNASVQRKVLVNGPEVTIIEEPGTPHERPPLKVDFVVPQRAVVLQFGYRCNEGHDCLDSDGRRGVDAAGIELRAHDRHGNLIASTHLDDTWDASRPVPENRTDLMLGVRHEQAEIASVALHFRYESTRQARPMQAVQLLRRVYQEPLPHAAVREVTVAPGAPVTFNLPFRCDHAVAINRGYHLRDDSAFLHALVAFEYDLDTQVTGRRATVSVTGRHVIGGGTPFTDIGLQGAYATVLCWDGDQVEMEVTRRRQTMGGRGYDEDDRRILDPCRNGACGGDPGDVVVLSSGLGLDYDVPGIDRISHDLFTHMAWPMATRLTADGAEVIRLEAAIAADTGVCEPRDAFAGHIDRLVFTGRSVVADAHVPPDPLDVPDVFTLPDSIDGAPDVHYGAEQLEALGYFCDVDAPVAAVGGRVFLAHFTGNGLQQRGDDRAFVRELDMELRAQQLDDIVKVRVAGGVDIGESFDEDPFEGDHGQIFLTPACVGVQPVLREARPVIEPLEFVGLPGQTVGPHDGGALRNIGVAPVLLTGARFTGDTQPFKNLEVYKNGRSYGPIAGIGHPAALRIDPGDVLTVDGDFTGPSRDIFRATLRFASNVGDLEMPVRGRVPDPLLLMPEAINFGMVEVGHSRQRAALAVVPDVIPVRIVDFVIEDDPLGAFTVDRTGLPIQLQPGDSHVAAVSFHPRSDQPAEREATLVALTDVGRFEMPLLGWAVPPPEPAAEVFPGRLQFGAVASGTAETRTVELRSVGAGRLDVTGIRFSGDADYTLVNPPTPPLYRATGETVLVDVRFEPTQGEDPMRYAELVFETNAGDLTVEVSGYAAP